MTNPNTEESEATDAELKAHVYDDLVERINPYCGLGLTESVYESFSILMDFWLANREKQPEIEALIAMLEKLRDYNFDGTDLVHKWEVIDLIRRHSMHPEGLIARLEKEFEPEPVNPEYNAAVRNCIRAVRQHTAQPEVVDDLIEQVYDTATNSAVDEHLAISNLRALLTPYLRTNSKEEQEDAS